MSTVVVEGEREAQAARRKDETPPIGNSCQVGSKHLPKLCCPCLQDARVRDFNVTFVMMIVRQGVLDVSNWL